MSIRDRILDARTRSRVMDILYEVFNDAQEGYESLEERRYQESIERGNLRDMSYLTLQRLANAMHAAQRRAWRELGVDKETYEDILIGYGYDPREIEAMMEKVDAEDKIHDTPLAEEEWNWVERGLQDLESNFLWILFTQKRGVSTVPVWSYATFSLSVAVRAVITFLCNYPQAEEILDEVSGPGVPVPTRKSALAFYNDHGERLLDLHEYTQLASATVPNILVAAGSLLEKYEKAVDWMADSPHPMIGQGFANIFVPPDPRIPMNYAVSLYKEGRSIREVVDMTRIPRRQVVDELKERGIMRGRGRPEQEKIEEVSYDESHQYSTGD